MSYALAVGLIFGAGTAGIFGYGGYLVYRDQFVLHAANGMTVGDLMIVLTYLTQLYDPLTKLSGAGATVMGGVAAAQRVFEVLDQVPQLTEATESGLMTKIKVSAVSMLVRISCCHSAVSGMSFQSTQASRFCAARASPSLSTKSLSLRE